MSSLEGRVALITGAGAGIGRESAQRMAEAGATVLAVDVVGDAAAETAQLLRAAGGSAHAFEADVGDTDRWRELISRVEREHRVLDVLFHHAGISSPPGFDLNEDGFDRLVSVNLKSGFFGTAITLPLLERSEHASIIFTASVAGLVGSPRGHIAYSMSKGGVIAMAKALALHLAPRIRVNAICPGPIETETFRQGGVPQDASADPGEQRAWVLDLIPLERLGAPGDIASAAVFLASDASRFMTGVALPVDGGYVAR